MRGDCKKAKLMDGRTCLEKKNPKKVPNSFDPNTYHHLKMKILMNISLLFCCPSPRLNMKKKVPAFIANGLWLSGDSGCIVLYPTRFGFF